MFLDYALRLRPRRVALVLTAVIAAFALLAALHFVVGEPFGLFRPDGEGKPPAAFSAGLLLVCGLLAVLGPLPSGQRRFAWRGIGVLLCAMSLDEALLIHERLQSLTGVDWLTLYLPLVALGAVLWLLVAVRLRSAPPALALWFAGAGGWAVAQVLEQKSWEPGGIRVSGWEAMSIAEEALEAAGSAAFFLTMLTVLGAGALASAADARRHPAPSLVVTPEGPSGRPVATPETARDAATLRPFFRR